MSDGAFAIAIFGVPAILVAFMVWIIASGQSRTNALPPGKPSPYPARLDHFGRWLLVIFTAILYITMAVTVGPLEAAGLFGILILIDVIGAFIWTCIQEIAGRRPVPFGARLFRNTRDFYINILGYGA